MNKQEIVEYITNHSRLVEMPPELVKEKEYLFASLNKNNTIKEYQEEVYEKEEYYKWTCITTHIWFIDNYKALELLENNLLTSMPQLKGKGGDYEKKVLVIAVVYKDQVRFVIDPQGYSYARYVGLHKYKRF